MFSKYDPFTGEGCYDFENRVKVEINDFIVMEMWVPKEMLDNFLMQAIIKYKTIKNFIEKYWKKPVTNERRTIVIQEICKLRLRCDPEFAMFVTDKIVDKKTGALVPFRLNYPQRLLLKEYEDMRRAGKPILLVLAKARQWGGSTLTQLYIKWMQDFICDGWNAIILAQVKGTAKKIKAMYRRALENQAGWTLGLPGQKVKFAPFENSQDDFIVKTDGDREVRRSTLTVASFDNFDGVRGDNFHMAHYSEVAYWKKTPEHDPEAVISSISGGILAEANNLEVFESSGRGASGLFYDLYKSAKEDPSSAYRALFIPFYQIENDRIPIPAKEQKMFARWLLEHKGSSLPPLGYRESGKFFWRLWKMGATFEAINWYRFNRNRFTAHAYFASEAPIDDNEAFRASGNLVFNPYAIDELEQTFKRAPKWTADVNLIGDKDLGMIVRSNVRIREDGEGLMKVWSVPNNDVLDIKDRYLVSVDIGGKNDDSDFTVITVLDRMGMMTDIHSLPQVVARWRGHARHDQLAWIAAVVAHWYDDALLVIESNTSDMERDANAEGDHFGTIINEIAPYYRNMYQRRTAPEDMQVAAQRKYGFQTNKLTKIWIIDNLTAYLDDMLWDEPDSEMYKEMRIYERKENGSMGNIEGKGNHDDVLMSTAIALYVSEKEMERPKWRKKKQNIKKDNEPMTEAQI